MYAGNAPWPVDSNVECASATHIISLPCNKTPPAKQSPRTDCSSNFFCSLLRAAISSANSFFFFSSYSSACSLSFACCFFSMSARRFCAVVDEFCANVPNNAPKSRCPRLRSSACPFNLRAVRRSESASCVACLSSCWPSLLPALRRRRL